MLVSKPAGCTSETNCQYICDKFVGVGGAEEEAVDLTGAGTVTARRLTAKSTIVYGSTGYEADADANSVGGATETYTTDAGFPETVSGAGYYMSSAFYLAMMLLIVLSSSGG